MESAIVWVLYFSFKNRHATAGSLMSLGGTISLCNNKTSKCTTTPSAERLATSLKVASASEPRSVELNYHPNSERALLLLYLLQFFPIVYFILFLEGVTAHNRLLSLSTFEIPNPLLSMLFSSNDLSSSFPPHFTLGLLQLVGSSAGSFSVGLRQLPLLLYKRENHVMRLTNRPTRGVYLYISPISSKFWP